MLCRRHVPPFLHNPSLGERAREQWRRRTSSVLGDSPSRPLADPAHQFTPQRIGGIAAPLVLLRCHVLRIAKPAPTVRVLRGDDGRLAFGAGWCRRRNASELLARGGDDRRDPDSRRLGLTLSWRTLRTVGAIHDSPFCCNPSGKGRVKGNSVLSHFGSVSVGISGSHSFQKFRTTALLTLPECCERLNLVAVHVPGHVRTHGHEWAAEPFG